MGFRKDFIWGTATAAYQIEGAWNADGKGECIWDTLTHAKQGTGFIEDDSTGDTACDHYHRFREDVALMAAHGIRNYRFSVNWSRVLPEGTGAVNEAGVRWYSDLIDCLLAHGIRPFMTLYHWDLPTALHRRGGWLNPDMPEWFAEYATLLADRFGDRVKDFFTINEPQCVIGLGYDAGDHAPGLRCDMPDLVRMVHNLLKAHGRAAQVLRDRVPGARIGYAPCAVPMIPATDRPEDIEAAKKAYFGVAAGTPHALFNVVWFSDPVVLGSYNEQVLSAYGHLLPAGWEKDLKQICQPLDYYAQNIYQGFTVRAADNPMGMELVQQPVGVSRTACGWPVTPEALYWGPKFLCERYPLPLIITENGMSCHDTVSLDGQVHDPNRVDFTRRYLRALRRAVDEGADVRGYFHWSFMDNFEWKRGYTQRFGLVYVDYPTGRRIPKDSLAWYQSVIAANGENL